MIKLMNDDDDEMNPSVFAWKINTVNRETVKNHAKTVNLTTCFGMENQHCK